MAARRLEVNGYNYDSATRKKETKDMNEELDQLVAVLRISKDPESSLLFSLLHTICERFPAINGRGRKYRSEIFLSCPCNETHAVTSFGFTMLQKAEVGVRGNLAVTLQKLEAINGTRDDILDHLEDLASRASRQKQPILHLETSFASFHHKPWPKLLRHCKRWNIASLSFDPFDQATESWETFWDGWSKVAAQGSIGELITHDQILAQGKSVDLKKVWKITKDKWNILCSTHSYQHSKYFGVELGWPKTLPIFDKIRSKAYGRSKTCFSE